jgi:hypothetical protein
MKRKRINKYKFYSFNGHLYYWCYSLGVDPEEALSKLKSSFKLNHMNPDEFEFINIT